MTKAEIKRKRRKRDKDGTQKKLMEAAVHLFASEGYDGATTKAVAEEAGVAEALIQRYFKGKQGLLMALMKDFAAGEIQSCIDLPPKAPSLEAEVQSILLHALTYCAEKKEYISVAIPRAVVDRSLGKELGKFLQTMRAPTLADRLKEHQREGSLSADADVEALSYALALSMLSVGFLGQIVMRLDPKTLNRLIKGFAKAFAGPRGLNA